MHDFISKTLLTTLIATSAAACSPERPAVDAGITPDAALGTDAPAALVSDAGRIEADAGRIEADAGGGAPDAGLPPVECAAFADASAVIAWTDVERSPGCTFFSGPVRSTAFHLGERGGVMGREVLSFEGGAGYEGGESVFRASAEGYERQMGCEDPRTSVDYEVGETFVGSWADWPTSLEDCEGARPTFRGTYTYSECEPGEGITCTPTCSLTATVTVQIVPEAELPSRGAVPAADQVMATCVASCAAREAVRSSSDPDVGCEVPDPSCVDYCIEGATGACGPEEYALSLCTATHSEANVCVADSFVVTGPPCGDAFDAFAGCYADPSACVVR